MFVLLLGFLGLLRLADAWSEEAASAGFSSLSLWVTVRVMSSSLVGAGAR